MNFDRIFILGAGAIGSVYGALLSEKNNVTLVGNRAHTEAINTKGLSTFGDTKKTFHIEAITKITHMPEKTLIILTTKAYDSAEAVRGIKKFLKEDTVILVLQNGLGNEETVKRIVHHKVKVLRGITTMAAEFLKPGKIRFWHGKTIVESDDDSSNIVNIFNECGLRSSLSENIERDVWTKVVVNCVVNPLTALFHVRNREIWKDSLKNVRHSIVRECVDVAQAEGIVLSRKLAEKIDKRVASYTNFSSMYQDVAKGKPTEIDFLNGKIVELGRKHDIQTPINETLVSFIKFLENQNGISGRD